MRAPSRCLIASCGAAAHSSSSSTSSISFFSSVCASAGPCPPSWHHPPPMNRRSLTVLLGCFVGYLASSMMLQGGCAWAGWSSERSGGIVSLFLHLSLLCTIGHILVSLQLRRPFLHGLCSRYGGMGEFRKMMSILPWIMMTSLIFTLRIPTIEEQRSGIFRSSYQLLFPASNSENNDSDGSDGGLILVPSLPLSFILAYFLGLHFTFLDGSSLLQSLGCKLPLPSLWSQLTSMELGVTFVGIVGIVGGLLPTIVCLLRGDEQPLVLLLSMLVLAIVVIYVADMYHTGSGTITTTGAASGANGLEAPMSGQAMWRMKIKQILESMRSNNSSSSNSGVAATSGIAVAAPMNPAITTDLSTAVSFNELRPFISASASSLPTSTSIAVSVPTPPEIFLHVHHYLCGLLLLPLLRFPCISTLLAAGVCFGITVEGVACWGMDPILVCKRPIEPQRVVMVTAAAATTATTTVPFA